MKRIARIIGIVACVIQLGGCAALDLLTDCGNLDFEALQQGQTPISSSCHDAIASLLPEAQTNFSSSKLVVLGAEIDGSNQPILYVGGIDANGTALTATDFSQATVTVIENGLETTLGAGEYAVESLQNLSGDVASLSYVTDYSASMSDGDIDDAADIFDDLIAVDVFPAIYEAEVYNFSHIVTTRQSFTETRQEVLDALVRDDGVERDVTALYDGMGAALTSLVARTRPVRILLVATDGMENDSTNFTKDQVTTLISDNKVLVVMVGTLFSDAGELEDLAGPRGIFFYAKTYLAARSQVAAFVSSIQSSVQMTLNSAYQNAQEVDITVGTLTVRYTM
jgi:hypothetical protein